MNTLTEEQSIYAKVASDACAHFSEVIWLTSTHRLKPAFKFQYAALSLRFAIETLAYAAIAPNKAAYQGVRGDNLLTDWHAERIFKALEKLNQDFFPLALTGPTKTEDGTWHYGRHSRESFTRNDAEIAYDRVSEVLHSANPWSNTVPNIDGRWLSQMAHNGLALLHLHTAFIRSGAFTGCWIVSRQPNGDWRFLTAKSDGDFSIDSN